MTQRTALVKERIWPTVNYEPHLGQQLIHGSRARHRVFTAGRRTGKSTTGGHELTPEALLTYTMQAQLEDAGQRREFWIVGPEYTDSEKEFRVVYNDLKRLGVPFDKPGTYNNPESGEMVISLWNGRFIVHAKSAKYPGTLVGEGLSGVIMAEAAKLKEVVWTKYIRPTLADFKGWSLWNTTPEGKNWFYRIWQRGQDPSQKAWDSWRMPSWMNPYVFPMGATDEGVEMLRQAIAEGALTEELILRSGVDPEIIDMMSEMTEERFNQEVAALFTEYVGRVFKDFDEEIHVADLAYRPDLPLYGAVDYGWTNPFVWLAIQVDVWDNVYVLGEYRAVQRDINDIAADLAALPAARNAKLFYPDPADPGDTAVLEKALHIRSNGNTGGELKWRLNLIRQHLKTGPAHVPVEQRKPKLYIDRSCSGLIQEMNDYRYPESKSEAKHAEKEEPMDKDDHGPEALGRFMRGYFGAPTAGESKGRATVRKANMTGRR